MKLMSSDETRRARTPGLRIMPRSRSTTLPSRISTRGSEFGLEDDGVVAGDEDGLAVILELPDDGHEFVGELGVQVGGRFVGDDDGRVVDERPGDGHPLGLAAGEPLDLGVGLVGQAEQRQGFQGAVRSAAYFSPVG